MIVLQSDLDNRFKLHPAGDRAGTHELVRHVCGHLADDLNRLVPDGREKSLAMTKLEEVMFWANAGIAREPRVAEGRVGD
jgi:hypothetical protein